MYIQYFIRIYLFIYLFSAQLNVESFERVH